MNDEDQKSPPGFPGRAIQVHQQRQIVNVTGAAALLAMEPDLDKFYNHSDLERLAREFAAHLVSAARLGAAEKGM